MTTTAGNGPLPSGTARNPIISSLPDFSVTSFVVTSAAATAGKADATSTASTVIFRIFGSPVKEPGRGQPTPPARARPEGHAGRIRPARCAGPGQARAARAERLCKSPATSAERTEGTGLALFTSFPSSQESPHAEPYDALRTDGRGPDEPGRRLHPRD